MKKLILFAYVVSAVVLLLPFTSAHHTVLYFEDFESYSVGDNPTGWKDRTPEWRVQEDEDGNKVFEGDKLKGENAATWYTPETFGDIMLEAYVKINQFNTGDMILHVPDYPRSPQGWSVRSALGMVILLRPGSDGYIFELGYFDWLGEGVMICKWDGGCQARLKNSVPVDSNKWYKVRVKANDEGDGIFEVGEFVNGWVDSYIDTTPLPSPGKILLRVDFANAYFDKIKVYDLSPNAIPSIIPNIHEMIGADHGTYFTFDEELEWTERATAFLTGDSFKWDTEGEVLDFWNWTCSLPSCYYSTDWDTYVNFYFDSTEIINDKVYYAGVQLVPTNSGNTWVNNTFIYQKFPDQPTTTYFWLDSKRVIVTQE